MSFVTSNQFDVSESTRKFKMESSSSTIERRALPRSTSCSCDICSFNTLKEMERNHPPGLQMPYFHTGAPLAPRTGREQPYWYRPCYVGWQYFTSGSQVTQQASFLQSSSAFHFSQYHATEYRATGCHATGCHGSGCHATDYHSTVTENNINEPGGVAYDHGEFPKIVSVHSMAEGQNNVLQEPTEYHGNDGDDKTQSNCVFPESPLTKTAIGYDATDSKKTSDHSISTILDLPSSVKNCPGQNVSLVKPLAEDDSPRNDAKTNLNSEDHERGMAKGCSSSEDKEIKITNCVLGSPKFAEGLSKPALPEHNSGSTTKETRAPDMPCQSTLEVCPSASLHITPLKIKKNTLILHRIRKINKIQKRLKRELSERKKARFLKKIEMWQKEIEILKSGSPKCRNPLNDAPVKSLSSAPNMEKIEQGGSMADSVLGKESYLDLKADFRVDTSMGENLSSEQAKGDMSESGFRMNLFEKLGFLSEQDNSCEVSTSSDSSPDGLSDHDSQNATEVAKERIKEVLSKVAERKDELDSLRFYSKQPTDSGDEPELNENADILVKSAETNCRDTASVCKEGTVPNNWSSAYVYENLRKESDNGDLLKRKQSVVLNDGPTKRRCKSLPRKVVWKVGHGLDKELLQGQETEEICEERQNGQPEIEVTCEGENSDSKPFAGIVNIDDDVSTSNLSINPVTELSTGCNPKACWVYDDDTLQRKLELRESKISELLRKQEGLLQTIEKLGTTHFPTD